MAARMPLVTALARHRTSTLAHPPTSPDDLPPEDPGPIPLTAAEIKRVFNLVTRTWQTIRHYLHWSWWRRRHQAIARWFHQRARCDPPGGQPMIKSRSTAALVAGSRADLVAPAARFGNPAC